ncbi:glycosyltransferase [Deinococcus sp. PESE-13]
MLTERVVFRGISAQLADLCTRLGLPARPFAPPIAPSLMLQPSVPRLEYPRRDLPPQVRFIGPLIPPTGGFTPPAWWNDVVTAERPVVLITQGTLATRPEQLLRPALAALADEDVLVVAAGVAPARLGPLPTNGRAAAFVPFTALLPHVAVSLTNGGYGGTVQALSHGVPCVVAGRSEDKAEVAARVAYSGAGLNLSTATPSPARIRAAVRRVLREPAFREQAGELGRELRQHDAPREAADWLETLGGKK